MWELGAAILSDISSPNIDLPSRNSKFLDSGSNDDVCSFWLQETAVLLKFARAKFQLTLKKFQGQKAAASEDWL